MTRPSLHDARTDVGGRPTLETDDRTTRGLTSLRAAIPRAPVEFLGFWAAVALPALYLPLLIAGLNSASDLATFLVLLSIHVVMLVIGHPYEAT